MEFLAGEWLALFNFATLPFYWGRFEPERGKPDTRRVLAAARWFADRGVAVKGHPLCWHTVQPDWLLPLSNDEILEAQKARIRREVTDFRGLIDTWDAINEAVIMPVFENGENAARIGLAALRLEAAPVERKRREVEEGEPLAGQKLHPGPLLTMDLVVGERDEVESGRPEEELVAGLLEDDLAVGEGLAVREDGQGCVGGAVLLDAIVNAHPASVAASNRSSYQLNPMPTASCSAATILDWAITWTCPFLLPPRGLQRRPHVSMYEYVGGLAALS